MNTSDSGHSVPARPRRPTLVAAIVWTGFVIYGSLLPFDFTPQPLAMAWRQFVAMPVLEIGVASRADWLANLLLYVPLTYLWLAALDAGDSGHRRRWLVVRVVATAVALALAIEFAQLFFPRTVSCNDVVAELIGNLLGAAAWLVGRDRLSALSAAYLAHGQTARRALAIGYVLGYLALALFPYDFVLSPAEFAHKDFAQRAGWWLAAQACTRDYQCPLQLAAEVAYSVPIGVAMVAVRGAPFAAGTLLVAGVLFGAGIEAAQLFLLSGVTQGASVLAKAAGVLAGGLLPPRLKSRLPALASAPAVLPVLALLSVGYVGALTVLLGFGRGTAVDWSGALVRLGEVQWLPFFNYYYTSEARAMASVAMQAAMFAPAGFLIAFGAWVTKWGVGPLGGASAAGVLALAVQFSRLVHPPQRADPTDVLIAVAAGAGAHWLATRALALATDTGACGGAERPATPPVALPARGTALGLVPVLLAVVLMVATFPVGRIGLVAGIAGCWALMLRSPHSWLVLLLALLPVVDLAPWSGRYFVDEFDLMMLVLVLPPLLLLPASGSRWRAPFAASFAVFAFFGLLAIARGVTPWPSPELAGLAGYQSPLNGLRVGRGLLWALAVIWLLGREPPGGRSAGCDFAVGMTLGLLGVGLVVLWERLVFTGPFNFATEYRVAGPFSAISTAGAQLESYLSVAIPFALLVIRLDRRLAVRVLGVAALLLGLHAMVVTASRAAYLGVLSAVTVMAVAMLLAEKKLRHKMLFAAGVLTLLLGVAAVVGRTFVVQRLEAVQRDLEQRKAHWRYVLDLVDQGAVPDGLGMGIGQYPPTYLWKASPDRRPATFAFLRNGAEGFLRMGAGRVVYVGQFVPVEKERIYVLRGRLRASAGGQAVLNVALCDKWILYSYGDCQRAVVRAQGGDWEPFVTTLRTTELGHGPPLFRRPVSLSLYNGGTVPLDVTAVSLSEAEGGNILHNGDFSRGGDRWYFSADDHFPWNVFNLPVEVYFEQGWAGTIALVVFAGLALWQLLARSVRGDLLAAAFLAGLLGFLVPAMFDTVIDDPRMRMLLLILLCGGVLLTRHSSGHGLHGQSPSVGEG